MSETDTCRDRLAPFCKGVGLDIGFGSCRPIVDSAITVDQPMGSYGRAVYGDWPTQIECDAFAHVPFADNALDYVFSSHCLEDAQDTAAVLREWLRVIKPGGVLVLFLPDQHAYVAHCRENNSEPNGAHKHADFSLAFVKEKMTGMPCEIIHEAFPVEGNPYSFDLVLRKTSVSPVQKGGYRDRMYED